MAAVRGDMREREDCGLGGGGGKLSSRETNIHRPVTLTDTKKATHRILTHRRADTRLNEGR